MIPNNSQFSKPPVDPEELKRYGVTEDEYHDIMGNQPNEPLTQEQMEEMYQAELKKQSKKEEK
jgi:hypothetical protein